MNSNPYKAREERGSKKQKSLAPVIQTLEKALKKADEILDRQDEALRLKAIHAVSQLSASYARVYVAVEMEARLVEVEKSVAGQTSQGLGLPS
jgi:hypothetical protein